MNKTFSLRWFTHLFLLLLFCIQQNSLFAEQKKEKAKVDLSGHWTSIKIETSLNEFKNLDSIDLVIEKMTAKESKENPLVFKNDGENYLTACWITYNKKQVIMSTSLNPGWISQKRKTAYLGGPGGFAFEYMLKDDQLTLKIKGTTFTFKSDIVHCGESQDSFLLFESKKTSKTKSKLIEEKQWNQHLGKTVTAEAFYSQEVLQE